MFVAKLRGWISPVSVRDVPVILLVAVVELVHAPPVERSGAAAATDCVPSASARPRVRLAHLKATRHRTRAASEAVVCGVGWLVLRTPLTAVDAGRMSRC